MLIFALYPKQALIHICTPSTQFTTNSCKYIQIIEICPVTVHEGCNRVFRFYWHRDFKWSNMK